MSIKANEQSLVNTCLDWLRLSAGCDVWRQNQGATKIGKRFVRFSHRDGISDIIGVTKCGRFVAVECKTGKAKPSATQREFLDSVRSRGGFAAVVHNLEELQSSWDTWEGSQ